jgi:large subunit ribosomal protein L21
MDYAIIRLGGKQYRVREGETLVVDRVKADEGKTFNPDILLGESGVTVTAKVVAHERGPKIRIGKYRKRTGYKRHNGFRAATSRIEISLGGSKRKTAAASPRKAEAPAPAPKAGAKAETPKPEAPKGETPETPEAATPKAEAPGTDHVAAMPSGYEQMTVAQINEASKGWNRPMLEAALEYEQAHAARKGAIAALESALKAKED